jgi:hypothetical protein
MNDDHVPSSPHFFRPVVRALLLGAAALCVLAVWIRAPLEGAADPTQPPNPARSAWFLLWIQELVSYGTTWMYAVLALAVAFVGLPWMRRARADRAAWLAPGERVVGGVVVALSLAVIGLTIVAMFLRGEHWRIVWPS